MYLKSLEISFCSVVCIKIFFKLNIFNIQHLSNIEDFIPFNITKHLSISQKLVEVNVKHVTWLLQHDVVIVSVTDSQHVGSHTVASTRSGEVVHSLEKKNIFISSGLLYHDKYSVTLYPYDTMFQVSNLENINLQTVKRGENLKSHPSDVTT